MDKYKPQLVWFDWWIAQPTAHTNLQKFAAFYYNRGQEWGKGVAINYKKHGGESFPDTAGVLDIERGQLASLRPLFWQTDSKSPHWKGEIASVELLGTNGAVKWARDESALTVDLPAARPSAHALVLRIAGR